VSAQPMPLVAPVINTQLSFNLISEHAHTNAYGC